MNDIAKAVELLTQINMLAPLVISVGKSLASQVSGSGTTDADALKAVADFAQTAKAVREVGEEWLRDHPEIP
jgi:flagellar assembly factor FliW